MCSSRSSSSSSSSICVNFMFHFHFSCLILIFDLNFDFDFVTLFLHVSVGTHFVRCTRAPAEFEPSTAPRPQAMGRGRGGVNPPQDWGLVDWLIPLHALRPEASADFHREIVLDDDDNDDGEDQRRHKGGFRTGGNRISKTAEKRSKTSKKRSKNARNLQATKTQKTSKIFSPGTARRWCF